jgi:hypothetical protein
MILEATFPIAQVVLAALGPKDFLCQQKPKVADGLLSPSTWHPNRVLTDSNRAFALSFSISPVIAAIARE